jgi:hypothetical protein
LSDSEKRLGRDRLQTAVDSTDGSNTSSLSNQRSVADEAKTSDSLHGEPEGTDVGALAEG